MHATNAQELPPIGCHRVRLCKIERLEVERVVSCQLWLPCDGWVRELFSALGSQWSKNLEPHSIQGALQLPRLSLTRVVIRPRGRGSLALAFVCDARRQLLDALLGCYRSSIQRFRCKRYQSCSQRIYLSIHGRLRAATSISLRLCCAFQCRTQDGYKQHGGDTPVGWTATTIAPTTATGTWRTCMHQCLPTA